MAPSSSDVNRSETVDLLFDAAFEADLELVKELAKDLDDKGEGISKVLQEVRDSAGKAILHCAVAAGPSRGVVNSLVKYLVEELNLDVNVQDKLGYTPLHLMTIGRDLVTCAYLLDHGACPNVANYECAPLHSAAITEQKEMLQLLISKGAEINGKAVEGTPLFYAAQKGRKVSVEILLENHADPNLAFDDTDPPMAAAIHAGSVDCVRLLLKWEADPNVSSCGENPLYSATVKGHVDIINCLLNDGADPNAPNFWGVTPIELAAMYGFHTVVEALFPATSPIPAITDWTVRGIFSYVNSIPFTTQWNLKMEEKFNEAKAKGAEAYGKGQFYKAKVWYSVANHIKPEDEKVLANRSLCYARLTDGKGALEDAIACIKLKGDWPKAHYRAGAAYKLLRDYKKAVDEFGIARELEPDNREIQTAYRETMLELQAVRIEQEESEKYGYTCISYEQDDGSWAEHTTHFW